MSEEEYRLKKQQDLQLLIDEFVGHKATKIKPEWIWLGSGSRRRVTFQIDGKNNLGFFAEKSHKFLPIDECSNAEQGISDLIPGLKKFLAKQEQNLFIQLVVTSFDNGLDLVFVAQRELSFSQNQKLVEFGKTMNFNISCRVKKDLTPIFLARKNQIFYPDFKIDVSSDVFIQATKSGLQSIIEIIRSVIPAFSESSAKGIKVADIYAGFGAYSFAICNLVHSIVHSITAFEGDAEMVDSINRNSAANGLGNKIKAEMKDLFLDPLRAAELKNFDLVIINPPRNGAAPQVKEISQTKNLRKVVYVSCNPQSFFRDAKIFEGAGFEISKLVALDQFYQTKHLELVAIFAKT